MAPTQQDCGRSPAERYETAGRLSAPVRILQHKENLMRPQQQNRRMRGRNNNNNNKKKNSSNPYSQSILESFRELGGSTVDTLKKDLLSPLPGDFRDQIFGIPKRSFSGEIMPGENLEMKEVSRSPTNRAFVCSPLFPVAEFILEIGFNSK